MCGLLFLEQHRAGSFSPEAIEAAMGLQRWRGPDAQAVRQLMDGRLTLGHNRLAIIDPVAAADQPMRSADGRWWIVFNGEIYNFRSLRDRHQLPTRTQSDTEVLLEGFARMGEAFFAELEGMYAFVIVDSHTGQWVAARDPLGIKPLYIHRGPRGTCLASEARVVAHLMQAGVDETALAEWRWVRRPSPGHSFFHGVDEVLPGTVCHSDGRTRRLWSLQPSGEAFDQHHFERLLREVVREHETSDVRNVALLSGGIDSSLVLALSGVGKAYSVGLPDQNEFDAAGDTATLLRRTLQSVTCSPEEVEDRWRQLTRLRGEPLSVPNEALIHAVCEVMAPDEKVVLTGEGADELMFGYDRLCRWAAQAQALGQAMDWPAFWALYGYGQGQVPERLQAHMADLARGKGVLDFVEDMLYTVHLPGLLRRMDFAAMAASREARVPFADRRLVQMCYRQPDAIKLNAQHSKLPLRDMLSRLGVDGPLGRPKIGFAVQTTSGVSRQVAYQHFQDVVLKELSWS